MLEGRKALARSSWVFAEDDGRPMLGASLDHLHAECRKTLKMPTEFVLHCVRHTYGTRLGEAGADAFTIMRLMGHSSVTVSRDTCIRHPRPWSGQWNVRKD
jgi:integrase